MMETVRYNDEEPVTYKSDVDRYLLETLKYGLGLTIREVYPMLQKMLLEGLDADAGGLLEVPFDAELDEARQECGRQIKVCQMLLEGEVDRAELVLRNSIEWCQFWSVRAPTAELREMFGKSLKRLVESP